MGPELCVCGVGGGGVGVGGWGGVVGGGNVSEMCF